MQMTDMLRGVEVAMSRLKRPGLSVFAADVATPRDLVLQSVLPQARVRLSTLGRIRQAGFTVEQTFDPPHHTVWLPDEDWSFWLARLEQAFDQPVTKADL